MAGVFLLRCLLFVKVASVSPANVSRDEARSPRGLLYHNLHLRHSAKTTWSLPTNANETIEEGLQTGNEPLPKMYHRSEEVRRLVTDLASPGPGHCQGLHLTRAVFSEDSRRITHSVPIRELEGEDAWSYTLGPQESALDVVRISREDLRAHGKPPLRYALFFGEHGRELVSTEVGVHLLKALCGHGDVDARLRQRASQVLSFAEVLLLPNIDESGRRSVEDGWYCQRQNLEHVDLNRNWDYKWEKTQFHDQGPYPFSEPETRIAKKHLESFRPNAFLSVHSGDRALWTPGAYSFDDGEAKQRKGLVWETLLKIANNVNAYTHCKCKIGAPGKITHKHHPGTSIDYVGLKMNVPYAMAWEIWLGHTQECLAHYNPISHKEYEAVLDRWSTSAVYFAEMADFAMRTAHKSNPILAVEDTVHGESSWKVESLQPEMEVVRALAPTVHEHTQQKEHKRMQRKKREKRIADDRPAFESSQVGNQSMGKDIRFLANPSGTLQRLTSRKFNTTSHQSRLPSIGNIVTHHAELAVRSTQEHNCLWWHWMLFLFLGVVFCIGARGILDNKYEQIDECKQEGLPLRSSVA